MNLSDRDWKESSDDILLDRPESCASCSLVEKFELKAESIVALCKNSDCARFNKPISYKYVADLKPSDKITEGILEYARQKVADRIARERRRQTKRGKHSEQRELEAVIETAQISPPAYRNETDEIAVASAASENARTTLDVPENQFTRLDEDFRQINDSFEGRFERTRKRLAKTRELRAKDQAEPESGRRAGTRGWDQLTEKYKKMLRVAEPELSGLHEKALGIDGILETRIKQVEEELPIKECELKVEEDLKEDIKKIEELQKQVGSLRQQQEECLPRKEKLRNLLDRIQYCATETRSAEQQPGPESVKEEAKERI